MLNIIEKIIYKWSKKFTLVAAQIASQSNPDIAERTSKGRFSANLQAKNASNTSKAIIVVGPYHKRPDTSLEEEHNRTGSRQ